MSEVLVANGNIQPGQPLTPDMVQVAEMARQCGGFQLHHPCGGAQSRRRAQGHGGARAAFAGQPITNTAIVHGNAAGFMAAQLEPGMRAVSIPISTDSGAGGFILPNDRVDLILIARTTTRRPACVVKHHPQRCARAGDGPDLQAGQGYQDRDRQDRDAGIDAGPGRTGRRAPRAWARCRFRCAALGDNQADRRRREAATGVTGRFRSIRYGVAHANRQYFDGTGRTESRNDPQRTSCWAPAADAGLPAIGRSPASGVSRMTQRARHPCLRQRRRAGPSVHDAGLNKAAVVELDTEAHDVLVSSPDIVDAVVRSPKRIFLLGLKTGQTNAFFFDARASQICRSTSASRRMSPISPRMMKTNLPNSAIKVAGDERQCRSDRQRPRRQESTRAADLAASFTGDPKKVVNMLRIAGGEQVMLKVRMAEMDRNIAKQFGVNLAGAAIVAGVPIVAATSNPYGLLGHALSDLSGGQVGSDCTGVAPAAPTSPWPGAHMRPVHTQAPKRQPTGRPEGAGAGRPGAYPGRAQSDRGVGRDREIPRRRRIPGAGRPRTSRATSRSTSRSSASACPSPRWCCRPGRISLQISTEVSELTNTGAFTLQGGTATINGADHHVRPHHSGPVGAPRRNHRRTALRRQLRHCRPDAA